MSEQLKEFPQKIPLLALRGLVLFPNMVLHFDVGRQKSMLALNDVMSKNRKILLVAQRDVRDDEPTAKQLYTVGVVAEVRQIVKSTGSSLRVLVEGLYRARVLNVYQEEPFFKAEIDELPMARPRILRSAMTDALMRTVKDLFEEYCYLSPKMPQDMVTNVLMSDDPIYIAEYIAGNISLPVPDKQKILELSSPMRRLEYLAQLLESENEILSLEQDIHDQVREQIDKNQREYYLREQIKVISAELGDSDNPYEEIEKYTTAIMKLGLPEADSQTLVKEAERLGKMPSNSHEAGVVRGYLDTVLALPWNKYTKDKIDIAKARKLLDKEHYGMKRVKERVLEILAVRKLAPDLKGQIICLVGPPGVGKTSIARSIAQTMNRKYARMSLGGVRDESDIRGHRKTYIGAMPGRIINAIKQSGSANPLLLLDEIDKLGSDFRGDPSSALLEVLDSEQNFAFRDHFIEIPFDLSNVLFIATANDLGGIPGPLADRMEIIELSSYTREEKFQIAKRHLLPKQLERNGLKSSMLKISDSALYAIIDGYTREAGVRTLERTISSVCRKAARRIVEDNVAKVSVTGKNLTEFLGPVKFHDDPFAKDDQVGVANGLAWTAVGGEMLQVEVAVMEGSGKNQFTGSLGDVMKESVSAAITWIRGHADRYGIDPDFYKNKDIHIHFPEGAVPKDGPSAGITTATAIVSALSGTPIRHDVAMTGEITLRGRVLPIGGLREKSMAAYKNGMKTVLIPEGNKPDLAELDPVVLENIEFVPVSKVEKVLELALVPKKRRQPAAETNPVKVSSDLPRDTAIPQ
ncbi:MAG: endopeptidase La [Oscillospiraceae bacterium]|nr:endopeptidase La [Oscillospiraceae bacterium]